MLRFLDIIMTPQDWEIINQGRRKSGLPEFKVDTAAVSNHTPSINTAPVDSIVNKGVADSIPKQDGIIDTLKTSGSFINGAGGGDDTTNLIWTALMIIAALALCFCLIRLYRKSLPSYRNYSILNYSKGAL